ncbi:MAG TPA: GNAT family N-acetyltransferase [Actinoplanes sp.]|nr:GNAT family N-acetyltransferase [Actinoplanes sp.]
MADVALRPVADADLDAIFDMMRDPEAVRMAAFTAEDPSDRAAFDAHMHRLRTSPDIFLRAVTVDGDLAGTIGSFVAFGHTEVTYWLRRPLWGRGIGSRALALLLVQVPDRPMYARAAADNAGSLRVLDKAGFRVVGEETAYATARGREITEKVLRLG